MVYRVREKAQAYKLQRRLVWRKRAKFVSYGLLAVLTAGFGLIRFGPQSISDALTSSRPSAATQTSAPTKGATQSNKTGSSKPAPKGTAEPLSTKTALVSTSLTTKDCTSMFPAQHSGLATSSSPELRKLAQYEQACNGAVAQRSSFFVPTPSTTAQAQESATTVAATLKAYAQAGISPLVFMEPDDLGGNNLDLSQYANGAYDVALNLYFQTLQSSGVTGAMMGMWVYLPEGNLPVWSTTDPAMYAAVVTKMAILQKQYFPGSTASLMLDSESYAPGAGWGSGSYVSLAPYVQNIPKGLFDAFGLQGFPWAAPANEPSEGSLYTPAVYLRIDFAIAAARTLGVQSIWLNTGTFNAMYANQPGQQVTNTPAQRQAMLTGAVQLAAQTKAAGFSVAIHLFAQNKAGLSEATDWSYWQQPGDGPGTAIFKTFAFDAAAAGIPIWLYDTY